MKLKKTSPKQIRSGHAVKVFSVYEGKLGEYRVVIHERLRHWSGSLMWGNQQHLTKNTETLQGAKLEILITYIRRLLNRLHIKHKHDPLFRKLYEACWFASDRAAPSVLCDWLEERGDNFRKRLTEACKKAGVKYCPYGWSPVLGVPEKEMK